MTKYKIIANPNAGHGKGAKAIPEIERELTEDRVFAWLLEKNPVSA